MGEGIGSPGFWAGLTRALVWPLPPLKVDDSVDPRKDRGSSLHTQHLLSPWIYYSLHSINKRNHNIITETDS